MKRSPESRSRPPASTGPGKDGFGLPTNRRRELDPALRGWNWEQTESVVGLGFSRIGLDRDYEREIAEATRSLSYREQVDWIRAHLAEPDNCRRLLKDDESLDWWLQAIDLLDVQHSPDRSILREVESASTACGIQICPPIHPAGRRHSTRQPGSH